MLQKVLTSKSFFYQNPSYKNSAVIKTFHKLISIAQVEVTIEMFETATFKKTILQKIKLHEKPVFKVCVCKKIIMLKIQLSIVTNLIKPFLQKSCLSKTNLQECPNDLMNTHSPIKMNSIPSC